MVFYTGVAKGEPGRAFAQPLTTCAQPSTTRWSMVYHSVLIGVNKLGTQSQVLAYTIYGMR